MRSFLAFLLLTVALNSQAQVCAQVFSDGPKVTESFSQFIRSHPEKFFSFLEGFSEAWPQMKEISAYKGWISGDSHPGQWTFVPNKERFIYTLTDFDMAGRGPLIVDFMQYALNVKAIIHQSPKSKDNIRIKDMLLAYVAGLKGQQRQPPHWIQDVLQKTAGEYFAKEQRYYGKKISSKDIKLIVEDGFVKIENQQERDSILRSLDQSSYFDGYEIRDVIQKKIERGGSAGQKRYWVLVTKQGQPSTIKIFELKEKQYGILEQAKASGDKMYEFYWDNESHPDYFQVPINGVEFDVRPKKVAFRDADIPYKLKSDRDWSYLTDKVLFDLYLMGQKHARQMADADYANSVEGQISTIAGLTKEFIEAYIKQFGQK